MPDDVTFVSRWKRSDVKAAEEMVQSLDGRGREYMTLVGLFTPSVAENLLDESSNRDFFVGVSKYSFFWWRFKSISSKSVRNIAVDVTKTTMLYFWLTSFKGFSVPNENLTKYAFHSLITNVYYVDLTFDGFKNN